MDDLISRSALLEELKEQHDYIMQDPEVGKNMKWCEAVCFYRTVEAVESAPSVDAVEVVRCKDCKHGRESEYDFDGDTGKPLCNCCFMWISHRWHEYCSYGERRTGDA